MSVSGRDNQLVEDGPVYFCPCCLNAFQDWDPGPGGRPSATCPYCRSLERHRYLAVLLKAFEEDLSGAAPMVLEVSPTPTVARLLRGLGPSAYVGLDVDPEADGRAVQVVADLTRAPFATDSFDLAVCFHVLEHIPDDRSAISELSRVMKAGGLTFIQVPRRGGTSTDEDPEAAVEERIARFGRADHVRMYGDDFEERLEAGGIDVTPISPEDVISPELKREMNLGGTVWLGGGAPGLRGNHLKAYIRTKLEAVDWIPYSPRALLQRVQELEHKLNQTETRLDRLRSRRSVRVALDTARLFKPLFRLIRGRAPD